MSIPKFLYHMIYFPLYVFYSALYTKEAAELALSLQNAPLANRLIGLSLESHKVLFTVKDKRTSEILFLSEKIAKLELERKQ